jgi:hypothetical protein
MVLGLKSTGPHGTTVYDVSPSKCEHPDQLLLNTEQNVDIFTHTFV